jgi:hypothetical protein
MKVKLHKFLIVPLDLDYIMLVSPVALAFAAIGLIA